MGLRAGSPPPPPPPESPWIPFLSRPVHGCFGGRSTPSSRRALLHAATRHYPLSLKIRISLLGSRAASSPMVDAISTSTAASAAAPVQLRIRRAAGPSHWSALSYRRPGRRATSRRPSQVRAGAPASSRDAQEHPLSRAVAAAAAAAETLRQAPGGPAPGVAWCARKKAAFPLGLRALICFTSWLKAKPSGITGRGRIEARASPSSATIGGYHARQSSPFLP